MKLTEELPNNLVYKLTICILIITGAYLIHFNLVTSELYENNISYYRNELAYEHSQKEQLLNTVRLMLKEKSTKNEVENYVKNTR